MPCRRRTRLSGNGGLRRSTERIGYLFRLKQLLEEHVDDLARNYHETSAAKPSGKAWASSGGGIEKRRGGYRKRPYSCRA